MTTAGDMLDEERMKDNERDALEHLETMIPALERAVADAKMAQTVAGGFDGERSAVAVIYRRALWWLDKAREVPANAAHDGRLGGTS